MALKLNAGQDVKRGDFFFVDPFQVIVKEELRGRHKPPTDEQIIQMAESMLEFGQRQPVECRKVEGNKLLLNLGFTRTAAARLIRTGFTGTDGKYKQDAKFKLKVVVTDANDEQAFKNNVVENAHRNQTSPIDDAFNQARLRDKYGMSDAEIGRLYRYKDQNKVGRLRRLLSLPSEIQDLVHEDRLPVQAALDILDIPDDKKREEMFSQIIADANGSTEAGGKKNKIVGSKVRALVRENILNDETRDESEIGGGDEGESNGLKWKARSMREVRKFFEEYVISHDNKNVQQFGKDFLAFLQGRRKDKRMLESIETLAGLG
jgi:ParB-like chromosome segregation protein Spo0J